MKQIKTRLTHGEGIALDEFKSFFFFLNNLEDFTIAVHYYSLANERIHKTTVQFTSNTTCSDSRLKYIGASRI